MAKFFETNSEIATLASDEFEKTGLAQMGIDLKLISVTKAKTTLKVSKANPTTHFLTKKDVIISVYEDAFERLSDDYKQKLMEGCISNVAYDTEKDKLIVDNSQYGELFRMRQKYEEYADILEAAQIVMLDIEEEERQRKEAEKMAKKRKKG